jgi:hypothetical protein
MTLDRHSRESENPLVPVKTGMTGVESGSDAHEL